MANRYGQPTHDIIEAGLERGRPIHDLLLWNTTGCEGSRIAWWFTSLLLLYGEVNPKLETIKLKVNAASIAELKGNRKGLWKVLKKWKLFRYDTKNHRYIAIKQRQETDEEFKLRVQRTISKRVALWWVVSDLVEEIRKDGKPYPRPTPTPHTNKEFMEQVQCTEQTVTRHVNEITDPWGWEYCLRLRGNGNGKASYFVRHDYETLFPSMAHPAHKATHRKPVKVAPSGLVEMAESPGPIRQKLNGGTLKPELKVAQRP